MTRRITRRAALASLATAVAAGCLTDDSTERYWDDPPAFDQSRLGNVLDAPVPGRPALVPAPFAPEKRDRMAARAERLLAAIPDSLTAETLPNGRIRQTINVERDAVRAALDGISADATPLTLAETLADARGHAAVAAGTWAAVTTTGDPEDVTAPGTEIRREVAAFSDELPGVAANPHEGAVVSGAVERWLDDASRRTLVGYDALSQQENPIRTGDRVGDFETVRGHLDAGRHIRTQYVATVDDGEDVEPAIRAALEELGGRIQDHLEELHGEEPEYPFRYPGREAFLDDANLPSDTPSVRLLIRKSSAFFDDARYDPIARPGYEPTHPATALRRTYRALVHFAAFDALAERIADGEELFPSDGSEIAAAREEAIETIDGLAGSDAPLERWMGRRLVTALEEADEAFREEDADVRELARTHTEYVWLTVLGGAATEQTSIAVDALGGQ